MAAAACAAALPASSAAAPGDPLPPGIIVDNGDAGETFGTPVAARDATGNAAAGIAQGMPALVANDIATNESPTADIDSDGNTAAVWKALERIMARL